ncbi:MAG: hypothetical protein NHF93_00970 [Candidatus Shikimatogenerans bostrichidophilus]|nr:MAG: hypothetical protein NHF93_00970 [Candidatus Shikimatogenerans bostrichidophilus]
MKKLEKNKIIKKIIKLRKITKLGILICKKALNKNKFNIKNSIKYLKNKVINSKYNYITKKKLNNGITYSNINNKKNIGIIFKVKTETDFIINNKYFKKFIKKIIKISLKFKIKNKKKLFKNNIIKNEILNLNIIFKENIIINDYYYIKNDYINNYNHHNNKLSVIIGINIIDNYKKINKKKIYNITKYIIFYIIINNIKIKKKKKIK